MINSPSWECGVGVTDLENNFEPLKAIHTKSPFSNSWCRTPAQSKLDKMSNLKGSILVTGANGGLGSGIVSQIISSPELSAYHGLYAVRDAASATKLKSVLTRVPSSHSFEILSLDLSLLADVRKVSDTINSRIGTSEIPPIRALILNAGYHDMGEQSLTAEGLETSFTSNYLGHWLLTLKLLQSMDTASGRIIVVGSNSYE